MRPINLKIQGINSYVTEQEINFDKLSESNLFGIFGETGSGKTTILDAIIIALYGSSDREIIPNIINVNSEKAHIYFTFQIEGEGEPKKYFVKRDFTVRKSGIKSDAILLDENNKVLAEQPEQVNEVILKIVGIGKKEFQRCIALPQGEFDRFLTDTPANRKKTIAKLFNLEMFGAELQEKIRYYKDIATVKKLNVEDRLSSYQNANEASLEGLRHNLNENQRLLNLTTEAIAEAKNNFETLKKDYEINSKLSDLNYKMGLVKSEEKEIELLKTQIEYTKKYGEYVGLHNKQVVLESEISSITSELLDDKKLLLQNEDKIKETDSQLSIKNENLRSYKARLNLMTQDVERYQKLITNKQIFEDNREMMEIEIESVQLAIKDLKESLINYKKISEEQQSSIVKLEKAIAGNNEILSKLKEVRTVETIGNFVDYLGYLKNIITPDALEEVYQFDIHKEVNKLLDSIVNYENESRSQVIGLEQEYQSLLVYNKNLDELEENLEKSNHDYKVVYEKAKKSLDDASKNISICTAKIEEKSQHVSNLKHQLRELKTKISINKSELGSIKDISDYNELIEVCDKTAEEIEKLNKYKQELFGDRNELVVSIEVGTVQLESLKDSLADLIKQIKLINIDFNKSESRVDNSLIISDDQIVVAKNKIEVYTNNYNVLKAQIDELVAGRKNENADLNAIQQEMENIRLLESKEKDYSVNIALCNQFISQMKDDIIKAKQIENERNEIVKQLATVNELANLTSGGKLLDYVSEEYMQLITQFSNKFVYRISKGKYMLKYSGEFYVIDNFNGGIARSVKTLSGGERFIVSLSLALGISQSIAINNNRKINFFFIDEGFGSLSDEYVETVLNSFSSLIRLNFTVGFISHVEKMQNFINNRIVVTKKNNEEGSIVKQYY